ncbi:MAG: exopolysaccharide biosynthesis protein [Candidatus Binatota bacterium]|nr:exopolysaccharide biosynthesis protein [Candidatus Binatota bacterium]
MSRQISKHPGATGSTLFSEDLQSWLKTGRDKTLAGLIAVFAEKSFAIMFVLLMALPALPLPTGGVTHVTEAIVMLICLELIVGRRAVWLPKKWLKLDVGKFMSAKAIKRLIAIIKWFERFSRRRWSSLLVLTPVLSALGVIIFVFTAAAFLAPPFSGLDTLPSLGVVIISLGLILEDTLIVLAGIVVGIIGVGVEIAAGTALYSGITHFF